MENHETDYQRARRQKSEVKKYGVTTANPSAKKKEMAGKMKPIVNKHGTFSREESREDKIGTRKGDYTGGIQGNFRKVHKLDR
jgi:hypothetical protein